MAWSHQTWLDSVRMKDSFQGQSCRYNWMGCHDGGQYRLIKAVLHTKPTMKSIRLNWINMCHEQEQRVDSCHLTVQTWQSKGRPKKRASNQTSPRDWSAIQVPASRDHCPSPADYYQAISIEINPDFIIHSFLINLSLTHISKFLNWS